MELRHLRYFLAVATTHNFTRAADMVHISQPSLSIQIGALEEELGSKLFDRLGRRVILTQAGELFREHAERIIREVEQAVQVVQELQGAQRGRLVVGTLATVNSYLIPPLVSQFKQRFPGIHLQVHAQPSTDIVAGLLSNRLDVGICLLPVSHERLTVVPLFDERLTLVAPADHPLKKTRMPMHELAGLPLILMPVDYCLRKMVEAECAEARVDPKVVLEMTSPEGILQAVAAGTGLTVLPELYVRLRPLGVTLKTIDLYDPVPHHSIGLVFRSDRYQNLAAKEFGNLCRETMTALLQARKTLPRKNRSALVD
ncbi:MAG: LysR substrate-binding domain-containing protein [Nitrospira sp.]